MTPEMELINNGLVDLQKALMKSLALLASQVIDAQATVNVSLDLLRDSLIQSGRSPNDLDGYVQTRFDEHRTSAQNLLAKRLTEILGEPLEDLLDLGDSVH